MAKSAGTTTKNADQAETAAKAANRTRTLRSEAEFKAQYAEAGKQQAEKGEKTRFSRADRDKGLEKSKDASGIPKCEYCGTQLDRKGGKQNSYEADHTKARSKGGASNQQNLTPSFRTCNRQKTDKDLGTEWVPPKDRSNMSFSNDHLAAFVCCHVFENSEPVRIVSHETDGDWQFVCGGSHRSDEVPHVVGVGHLVERDRSLLEVEDLEEGWEAMRSNLGAQA
jgi:5-methylcytosine-specific restriction endonuclease McrA